MTESGSRIEMFLSRFNPRERIMLLVMVVFFACLFLFIISMTIRSGLMSVEEEIENRRTALNFLDQNRHEILKQKEGTEAFGSKSATRVDAYIADDNLKLIPFLDKYAQDAGIKIDRFEPQTISHSKKGKGNKPKQNGKPIVEEELKIEIRSTTYTDFLKFLSGIVKDEQPVYIKRIYVVPQYNNRDVLKVSMTVSVYKLEKS